MNRLSMGQFSALLLITDVFTLLCIMGNVSLMTVAGLLVGTALQYFLALPAAHFYKNGGTLKNSAKSFIWFYLIYILLWGGLLFVILWNASDAITIPSENIPFLPEKLLISGLIAVTCLYASSPGEKALSRASVISAALGAVCIALVIISAIPRFKMEHIEDLSHSEGFLAELMRGFVLSGGLGSFIVLLGFTKDEPLKYMTRYFIAKAALYTIIPLTVTAVVGGIMDITDFPVITAATLSQPFSTQRIDSLFLIIFVILAVFSISVQTVTASYLLSELFPEFKRFRSAFALLAMIASAFLLSGVYQYSNLYAIAVIAALLAASLLLIKKKTGGNSR